MDSLRRWGGARGRAAPCNATEWDFRQSNHVHATFFDLKTSRAAKQAART
jgi:hypothetical protein